MSGAKLTLPLEAGRWYRQRNGELYLVENTDNLGFAFSAAQKGRDPKGRFTSHTESPEDLVADAEGGPWSHPGDTGNSLEQVLRWIADGERLQWRPMRPGDYTDISVYDALRKLADKNQPLQFRRKPKTIRIGAFDVPEPLRRVPDRGFMVDINRPVPVEPFCSDQHPLELRRCLQRGLLHATREAAELHAKALLSFSEVPA